MNLDVLTSRGRFSSERFKETLAHDRVSGAVARIPTDGNCMISCNLERIMWLVHSNTRFPLCRSTVTVVRRYY